MLDTRAGRWLLIGIGAIIAITLVDHVLQRGRPARLRRLPPGHDDADGAHPAGRRHPRRDLGVVPAHRPGDLQPRAAPGSGGLGEVPRRHARRGRRDRPVGRAGRHRPPGGDHLPGISGDWSTGQLALLGAGLFVLLGMAQGVGFGMLFENTPAAIVLLFVLPTAWAILGQMVAGSTAPRRGLT